MYDKTSVLIANLFIEGVTKFRLASMGIAMIAVFLFHTPSEYLHYLPQGIYGNIISYGYLGVDVFLFLSAIGLCFSLDKNSINVYLKNRIVRILPAFFLVLLGVHLLGVLVSIKMPSISIDYPHTVVDCLFWYSGLGYLFDQCHYEWYIPALLILYLVAPFLHKLDLKVLSLFLFITLILSSVFSYYHILPHLERFYGRLPVFILGVFFYKLLNNGRLLFEWVNIGLISSIIVLFCPFCPITISFCFFTPCLIIILGLIAKKIIFLRFVLSFIGTISLEFYLIHCYRRPQVLISLFTNSHVIQITGAFIMCCIVAWLMHICIDCTIKKNRR